jgi:hypothetical protein
LFISNKLVQWYAQNKDKLNAQQKQGHAQNKNELA